MKKDVLHKRVVKRRLFLRATRRRGESHLGAAQFWGRWVSFRALCLRWQEAVVPTQGLHPLHGDGVLGGWGEVQSHSQMPPQLAVNTLLNNFPMAVPGRKHAPLGIRRGKEGIEGTKERAGGSLTISRRRVRRGGFQDLQPVSECM